MKRFVATRDARLEEVLAEMRIDAAGARAAIADGRIFVDTHRATSTQTIVHARAVVVVHAPRRDVPLPTPFVVFHRDGILVVDKPAGIPTIPDLEGARGTLIDYASRATSRKREDLHPTSRLDRDVSGLVTFALDASAKQKLEEARARGAYRRLYLAVAEGSLPRDRDEWNWAIARDVDPRKRRAVDASVRDAKPSISRAVVMRRAPPFVLLALAPLTGRTHQLRVHAARAGAPLVGDATYGGKKRLVTATGAVRALDRVALHCAAIDLDFGRGEKIPLRSPVPPAFSALAAELGLAPNDGMDDGQKLLEEALRCEPWASKD